VKNIKQVIVIRKDLKLRRGKLASLVAHAAMQFILDNNESDRNDELRVKLSQQEIHWLKDSFAKEVIGVDSQDALSNLVLKAELNGVNVYSIFDKSSNIKPDEHPQLLCAAFGPDEEDQISEIIGSLKSI
jgi:PTH2 family peptidyl-tRNA hydrolase